MSKQAKANRMFTQMITEKFTKSGQPFSLVSFCDWLIKSAYLPEAILNKVLAVIMYKLEIERTKSQAKPRGVKWQAIQRTLEVVPICEKTLRVLIKAQYLPKTSF